MICPADRAVMNHDFKKCLLSSYLQAEDAPRVCERRLHTVPPEPFLLRHGADIVFYTPGPCRAFFRCQLGNRWQTTTSSLHGPGLIKGAAACHNATERLRLRPVLRVASRYNSSTQQLYTPNVQLLSPEGALQAVRRFLNTSYFNNIDTSSRTRLSLADVTARYGIDAATDQSTSGTRWYVATLASVFTTSCLLAAYKLLHCFWHRVHRPRAQQRDYGTKSQSGSESNNTLSPDTPEQSNPAGELVEPTPIARYHKHVKYLTPTVRDEKGTSCSIV
jgi:hypothetical protein